MPRAGLGSHGGDVGLEDVQVDQTAERVVHGSGTQVGHGHQGAAVALEGVAQVQVPVDGTTRGRDDDVEGAHAPLGRGARLGGDPDDRDRMVRHDADAPDLVHQVQVAHVARQHGRDHLGDLGAATLDPEGEGLVRALADDRRDLVEGRHVLAVDGQDAVAREQAPVGRPVREHGAHDGRRELAVPEVDHEEEGQGEHEVHGRAREHDRDALPQGLAVEAARLLGGRDLVVGVLAEHAHVAADWQRRQHVFGVPLAEAQELRPEPEAELQHANAEELRPHEVPELVHEDEDADEDDEVDEVHGQLRQRGGPT